MAETKIEQRSQEHAAKQDDLLWTSKLAAGQTQALAGRLMPTLKSRIAGILDERFERFFKSVEEQAAGAKDGSTFKGTGTETSTKETRAQQSQASKTQDAVTLVRGAFDAALSEAPRFSPQAAGAESRDNRERPPTQQQVSRKQAHAQQLARIAQSAQQSWVIFAAQLIGANLKRLGLEPSELDDIRLFLIRQGAASYNELKKLTRLPDSLDPAAELKALEDIKTLMLAYVVQATQEQILSDLELNDEKEPIGFPKPIVNRFSDIPEKEVDPSKLLELGLAL